ncbi:MDS1 and EVI1 complex locus protein EVI1-A [Nephila pilipes]|uniref:MDS1 and EVI1 complex locus protein EVI1-A n=1 Tax=Nephila pilipes TaxID=299642 RepID=A0A8X6PQ04_NEPPI|nr:MDS1 and EVI1 complex locus protein EVI1-A [Nephila pilipes]
MGIHGEKVVDENGIVKAWADTEIRGGQWATYLQKPDNDVSKNIRPVFYGGQIYLEVIQDIEAGQELHLASYNLLLAHESHHRNGTTQELTVTAYYNTPPTFEQELFFFRSLFLFLPVVVQALLLVVCFEEDLILRVRQKEVDYVLKGFGCDAA